MNKSKILALSGLATVMSASVAMAGDNSVSVNGYIEGFVNSGDATTGISNTVSSQSIYVAYSSTMDNGMGLNVGFTLTNGTHAAGFSIDTGMGTLSTGTAWQMNSAADAMDSLPNNANVTSSNKVLGTYDDGDDNSGEGIKFTSNSMNGWTIAASVGEDTNAAAESDRVTSIAAKGSIMGVSVAAGAVDQMGAADDSFLTLGYSIAGVGLGYGMYDSDDDETTAISVTTSVAGMTVGYRFDDLDATTDNDQSTYAIGKDLGAMSLTLMYSEQDAADTSNWSLVYAMGF
jgi:hypothetical protein